MCFPSALPSYIKLSRARTIGPKRQLRVLRAGFSGGEGEFSRSVCRGIAVGRVIEHSPWLPDVADGLSWAPSTWWFLDQFGAWWASMVLTWRAVSAIAFCGELSLVEFSRHLGLGAASPFQVGWSYRRASPRAPRWRLARVLPRVKALPNRSLGIFIECGAQSEAVQEPSEIRRKPPLRQRYALLRKKNIGLADGH